jgi:4'-phosphopantetheinyl transferase
VSRPESGRHHDYAGPSRMTGSGIVGSGTSHSLALGTDEVHVWRFALDLLAWREEDFRRILAEDEQERADRLCFQRDRTRFIVGRGILRTILSGYTGRKHAHLRFSYGVHGKPFLREAAGEETIHFNLSHSQGMALFTFTRGRRVGIDVERIRPGLCDDQGPLTFFSPLEAATLLALPPSVRRRAFFRCWTRKESYLKARGEGLSLPLDQFDVSLAPGEPAALLETRGDPREASRWSLQELDLGPDYVATLAIEGDSWRLKYFGWPGEGSWTGAGGVTGE